MSSARWRARWGLIHPAIPFGAVPPAHGWLHGWAATECHAYQGLPHGFGLGTGTVAEGWIDDAVRFWEAQMPQGTTATEHVHAAGPNATAYDLQGRPVREGYRGIIIQNGNK